MPSININKYHVGDSDQISLLSVVSWGRSVSWGGGGVVSTSGSSGGLGLSGVGHISNIAVIVVGVVGDSLDTAVGKVDRVRSSNNTGTVIVLLLESSLGVVISHGVGELVGGDLRKIISNISGLHGGVVGGGSVDHGGGGVVGGGSVDYGSGGVGWSSVDNWGVVGSGVMDSVDTVVDTVGNNAVSSVQSVGGISNDGSVSSEGLALCGGPVLSLVRFAH